MSNLLHVLAKETALKYVEHVAEIYGGMAVMKEMPIEGFIRGMFKSGHELGTISTNVIRSLKLL